MTTLLLTARDPLAAGDGPHPVRAAADIARTGEPATLVLFEDAVTLTRIGHRDLEVLVDALDAGVEILVEEDALSRRAVAALDGIKTTSFAEVVDRLSADRSVWL
jgi:hypothetical protein